MITGIQETVETLKLTLDQSLPISTSLYALLFQQKKEVLPQAPIRLNIVLSPYVSVSIYDDLHTYGIVQAELIWEIAQGAHLTYLMRELGNLEQEKVPSSANNQKDTLRVEKYLAVNLLGSEAQANIRCLWYGDERQVFICKTLQNHQAAGASSYVMVKSVLADQAKLVCHSLIKVNEQAMQTHAEQVNKNILLSSAARVVSVPMLEVKANDVKCKHGAAISKLDQDQIFYAESRGIDTEKTKRMLLESFLT